MSNLEQASYSSIKNTGTVASTTEKASLLEKFSNGLENLTVYLCIISVGALCLDLILAVLSRYLFQAPIIIADELAMFLLAWATFLGASLSVKRNEMVAVTFLIERFGRKIWIAQAFIQIVILLFSLLLLAYGVIWVTSPDAMNTKASALQIPMWIPYLIFPISMLLTTIFSLDNLREIFKDRNTTDRS